MGKIDLDARAPRAPAVVKAIQILNELAVDPEPLSATELARRCDLPKSSVADLCLALTLEGLISRDSDNRYLLGSQVAELSRGLVGGGRLLEVFPRVCGGDAAVASETVTISVADGPCSVIVAVRRGQVILPITPKVGLRFPLWTTASGRALLSTMAQAELAAILKARTTTAAGVSGTVPSMAQLLAELRGAAQEGYFVDEQQTMAGMISFGAPIRAPDGQTIAALSVSTRAQDVTPERRRALGSAAARLATECADAAFQAVDDASGSGLLGQDASP
jgi:DNA-binding IclR family transcriptional regulator